MDTEEIAEIKRKILNLEWDKRRGQINDAKSIQLDKYKKQIEEFEANDKKAALAGD